MDFFKIISSLYLVNYFDYYCLTEHSGPIIKKSLLTFSFELVCWHPSLKKSIDPITYEVPTVFANKKKGVVHLRYNISDMCRQEICCEKTAVMKLYLKKYRWASFVPLFRC